MAISDETLALAIPPELKTDHPDASLVVQGILVAIAANENSGGLSAKGRMRDTFAALQSVFVPIFQAHIAKEDEDWNSLREKAALAPEPVKMDLYAEFPAFRYEKRDGKTRAVALSVNPDSVVARAREAGLSSAFWTSDRAGGEGLIYSGTREDGYPFYVFTEKGTA